MYNRYRDTFRHSQAFPLDLLSSYGRDEASRRAFGTSPLHLLVFVCAKEDWNGLLGPMGGKW